MIFNLNMGESLHYDFTLTGIQNLLVSLNFFFTLLREEGHLFNNNTTTVCPEVV